MGEKKLEILSVRVVVIGKYRKLAELHEKFTHTYAQIQPLKEAVLQSG